MLNRAITRVDSTNRDNLLLDKPHDTSTVHQDQPLVFSRPCSLQYHKVVDIVRKYLPDLHSDPGYSEMLQALSLGNILSPTLTSSQPYVKLTWMRYTGCYKCSHTRCICCGYMKVSNTFVSSTTQTTYPIKQYINCTFKYVVYLFTCKICHLQYTGSTSCNLKTRVRRHIWYSQSAFISKVSSVS